MTDLNIPKEAHALRPVRFMPDDQLREYTGTTFPNGPWKGCSMYARRCAAFGGVAAGEADATGVCDILDAEGDIIGDFWLNDKGLRYLYRALDLRVVHDDEEHPND